MRLYVPTNGDQLRITSDWTFSLYDESRNRGLHQFLDIKEEYRHVSWSSSKYERYPERLRVVLPAGCVLKVDRIYIRKFNAQACSVDKDFDSITFQLLLHPLVTPSKKQKVLARFWVKLRDANTMEFEHAAPPRWSQQAEDDA